MYWKKKKLLTVLANRRQWHREFDTDESSSVEIELEQGGYLVIESSISATPTYIITD